MFNLPFRIGSFIMLMWGSIMLIPIMVSGGNLWEIGVFLQSAACCYFLSWLLGRLSNDYQVTMEPRPLFLATSINWMLMSITGALPYVFSMPGLDFSDALFESIYGVTTTGSTVKLVWTAYQ